MCLDGLPDFAEINVHECWTDSKASQWIHFYIVMPSWNKLIMMKVTADNIQRNKREDNVFLSIHVLKCSTNILKLTSSCSLRDRCSKSCLFANSVLSWRTLNTHNVLHVWMTNKPFTSWGLKHHQWSTWNDWDHLINPLDWVIVYNLDIQWRAEKSYILANLFPLEGIRSWLRVHVLLLYKQIIACYCTYHCVTQQ